MAKIIKMTPEYIQECREALNAEFEKAVSNSKLADGKLNFTKTFGVVNRKATVYFSEIAWLKMTTLIREFSDEVAWHGTAYRVDSHDADCYVIGDIFVYPQEVTGATVNTDQEAYQTWLMTREDDVFNNLRFQGHSHVHMGVTPSSVDLSHQERILDQLDDDMFYIFMIWNKRHDVHAKIYDLQKNVLFEAADVTVQILDGKIGLESFLQESKELVKKKATSYNYQGQGYGRSPYYQGDGRPYNPVGNATPTKNEDHKSNDNDGKGKKKDKKDKKKSKMNDGWAASAGSNACEETQMTIYDRFGNEIDTTDPFGYCDGPIYHG